MCKYLYHPYNALYEEKSKFSRECQCKVKLGIKLVNIVNEIKN